MLGAESQFDNSNHVHSRNVSGNVTAQLSCTTTTLIKYRVKNFDSVNTTSVNREGGQDADVKTGQPSPPPNDGAEVLQNGLASCTTSPCNFTTAKTTTTTTFSVKSNNPLSPSEKQHRNMQQSNEGEKLTRPPFITTVTRGKFLPSKFDLLVEKSLFTFASRPRPVNLIKKHYCSSTPSPAPTTTSTTPFSKSSRYSTLGPSSRNECSIPSQTSTTTPPRGAHDYYNVMWDPHVVRGTTAATTRVSEQAKEAKSTVNETQSQSDSKLSKVKRSTTTQKPGTRYRYRPLLNSLSPPFPPIPGRLSTMMQTDRFLEELPADDRVQIHQAIQTEPIFESATTGTKVEAQVQVKYGVDNSTQILPGELFHFDDEVQPVLESLIGKILEQAMFETVEEEEIAALREEKNRFHQQRRREEKELLELRREHERISAEKEQLRRRLEDERSNLGAADKPLSSASSNMSSEFCKRESMDALQRVAGGTTVYTTSYLLELLPSVLNSLRQEGFLNDNIDEDTFSRTTSVQRGDSYSPPISKEDDGQIDEEERVLDINATNETQAEISHKEDVEASEPANDIPDEGDGQKWQRSSDSQSMEKGLEDLSASSPL